MKKQLFILTILLFSIFSSVAQNKTDNENLIFWSQTKKLTIDDFGIKKDDSSVMLSFGQFSIDYNIGGFSFLTKNFNKKVRNYMINLLHGSILIIMFPLLFYINKRCLIFLKFIPDNLEKH